MINGELGILDDLWQTLPTGPVVADVIRHKVLASIDAERWIPSGPGIRLAAIRINSSLNGRKVAITGCCLTTNVGVNQVAGIGSLERWTSWGTFVRAFVRRNSWSLYAKDTPHAEPQPNRALFSAPRLETL